MIRKYVGPGALHEVVDKVKSRVKSRSHYDNMQIHNTCTEVSIRNRDINQILLSRFGSSRNKLHNIETDLIMRYKFRGIAYRIIIPKEQYSGRTNVFQIIAATKKAICNGDYQCFCVHSHDDPCVLTLSQQSRGTSLRRNSKTGMYELSIDHNYHTFTLVGVQKYNIPNDPYDPSLPCRSIGTYVGKLSTFATLCRYAKFEIDTKTYLETGDGLYELISVRAVSKGPRQKYGYRKNMLQVVKKGDYDFLSFDGETRAPKDELRFILTLVKVGL